MSHALQLLQHLPAATQQGYTKGTLTGISAMQCSMSIALQQPSGPTRRNGSPWRIQGASRAAFCRIPSVTTKPLLLCASGAAANPLLMACGLQNGHDMLNMQHAGLGFDCGTAGSPCLGMYACQTWTRQCIASAGAQV